MPAQEIEEIISHEVEGEVSLIAALEVIQKHYRYLSSEVLILERKRFGLLLSQTNASATFYKAFNLKPTGKYCVRVCMGTGHATCSLIQKRLFSEPFNRDGRKTLAASNITAYRGINLENPQPVTTRLLHKERR